MPGAYGTEGTLVCDPEVGQEEELAAGPMGMEEFECLSGVGNPGWRPCCGPAGLRDLTFSEVSWCFSLLPPRPRLRPLLLADG